MNEIENLLLRLRDKIDDADVTPFGKMGGLLDAMAVDADAALALISKMKKAA